MNTVDFGKIQTAHTGLQKNLSELKSLIVNYRSFLIFGEAGTGRRTLAQMIHENSSLAGHTLQIYRANEMDFVESKIVLIPEIQFLNFREQEILSQQILSSDAESIWIATAQSGFNDLVKRGLVRKDLAAQFQKQISMPSLNDRAIDRAFLMNHFLMTLSWVTGKVLSLSSEAQDYLCTIPLKENIKELEEILEKAALVAEGSVIEMEHLSRDSEAEKSTLQISTLAEMEKKLIMQTLQLTQNNKTQAARLLGISIRTLRNKLSLYKEELGNAISREVSYE